MNGHEAIYQKYNDPDTCLPWGLLLTNCSDSESDYSDDNAYPPPTVELTSPSEIDVVEYNSTVTVSAKSFSAVGIHSIYATLLKMDEMENMKR